MTTPDATRWEYCEKHDRHSDEDERCRECLAEAEESIRSRIRRTTERK